MTPPLYNPDSGLTHSTQILIASHPNPDCVSPKSRCQIPTILPKSRCNLAHETLPNPDPGTRDPEENG